MVELGPKAAWFTVELTYGEAKALRSQIGDLPKSRVGPRIEDLYRRLDARLRLAGSVDDAPPCLAVVKPTPARSKRAPKYPKPAPRTPPENPCPACRGEGIVAGAVCALCEGFGEA